MLLCRCHLTDCLNKTFKRNIYKYRINKTRIQHKYTSWKCCSIIQSWDALSQSALLHTLNNPQLCLWTSKISHFSHFWICQSWCINRNKTVIKRPNYLSFPTFFYSLPSRYESLTSNTFWPAWFKCLSRTETT